MERDTFVEIAKKSKKLSFSLINLQRMSLISLTKIKMFVGKNILVDSTRRRRYFS